MKYTQQPTFTGGDDCLTNSPPIAKLSTYYYYANSNGGAWGLGLYRSTTLGGSFVKVADYPALPITSYYGGVRNIAGRLYLYYTKATGGNHYCEYQYSDDGVNWTTVTSAALGFSATTCIDLFVISSVVYMFVQDATANLAKFVKVSTTTITSSGVASVDLGWCDVANNRYYFHGWTGAADIIYYFTNVPAVTTVETITGGPGTANPKVGFLHGMNSNWILLSGTKMMLKQLGAWSAISGGDTGVISVQMDTNYVPVYILANDHGTEICRLYKVFPNGGMVIIDTYSDNTVYSQHYCCVDALAIMGVFYNIVVTTLGNPALNLVQKSQFEPVTGKLQTSTACTDCGIHLTSDAGADLGTYFVDMSPQDPSLPSEITLTGVEAVDLVAKVVKSYSAQTAAVILEDVLDTYSLFLSTGSINAPATTYTITFAGQTVSEVITWYCTVTGNVVYWNRGCVVTTDAGTTDSGIALTETSIFACPKTVPGAVSRVVLRSGTLTSVKSSTAGVGGWRTVDMALPTISNQTDLDAVATAILARLNTATTCVKLGTRLTALPLIGRTYTITYNIAPTSINAATLLLLGWKWNEYEAELTLFDANYIQPKELATTSGTQANMLNGDLAPNGHFLGSFVDRGDPNAYDYTQATLTINGAYHDLDLSAIVAANAKLILLRVITLDNATGKEYGFRKNGNSNGYNISQRAHSAANLYLLHDVIVACDANRVIEYYITTGMDEIYLVVRGWWI